ncbi:hypothetical protein IPZ58_36190 [Streptomyces roseoverticillatus]|uniref:hypothetical protein n=1 Tax=Streptomyces roseoverticillatus TaxID=66429 RepID=UPI001F347F55|nr:hypothetical protein [Streptomyces roseoverticillatus]MCF3106960.1 hypothetical protein [Streptomyces roseoverticillatus]
MTKRVPCPPAPGPLEAYAARFDDLEAPVTAQLWIRESVACFRSGAERKGRFPIVMFAINTPADLTTATRLGVGAVLVDSPRSMGPVGRS